MHVAGDACALPQVSRGQSRCLPCSSCVNEGSAISAWLQQLHRVLDVSMRMSHMILQPSEFVVAYEEAGQFQGDQLGG